MRTLTQVDGDLNGLAARSQWRVREAANTIVWKPHPNNGPDRIRTCNQGIMSPEVDSATAYGIISCNSLQSCARSRISSKNEVDPELHRLLDAWPSLSPPIRAAILALIEAESE